MLWRPSHHVSISPKFPQQPSCQDHGGHHAPPGFLLFIMLCILLWKPSSSSHFNPLIPALARGINSPSEGGIHISNSRLGFIFHRPDQSRVTRASSERLSRGALVVCTFLPRARVGIILTPNQQTSHSNRPLPTDPGTRHFQTSPAGNPTPSFLILVATRRARPSGILNFSRPLPVHSLPLPESTLVH